MIKKCLTLLLSLGIIVFELYAYDVMVKNSDDFPITLFWNETVKLRGQKRSQKMSFQETFQPHSEKIIKIGDQGPAKEFAIAITHRYNRLNKAGLNEFTKLPLDLKNAKYIELGTESLIKVLLGARSLLIRYSESEEAPRGRFSVFNPDIKKILEPAAADINLMIPPQQQKEE